MPYCVAAGNRLPLHSVSPISRNFRYVYTYIIYINLEPRPFDLCFDTMLRYHSRSLHIATNKDGFGSSHNVNASSLELDRSVP